jgi:hypothetical protein
MLTPFPSNDVIRLKPYKRGHGNMTREQNKKADKGVWKK